MEVLFSVLLISLFFLWSTILHHPGRVKDPGPDDTVSDTQRAQWFCPLICPPLWVALATTPTTKWQQSTARILQSDACDWVQRKYIRKDETLPIQSYTLLCNFQNQSTWSLYWNIVQCPFTRVFQNAIWHFLLHFPFSQLNAMHIYRWYLFYFCLLLMNSYEVNRGGGPESRQTSSQLPWWREWQVGFGVTLCAYIWNYTLLKWCLTVFT